MPIFLVRAPVDYDIIPKSSLVPSRHDPPLPPKYTASPTTPALTSDLVSSLMIVTEAIQSINVSRRKWLLCAVLVVAFGGTVIYLRLYIILSLYYDICNPSNRF
jgi:hypothetical protein